MKLHWKWPEISVSTTITKTERKINFIQIYKENNKMIKAHKILPNPKQKLKLKLKM